MPFLLFCGPRLVGGGDGGAGCVRAVRWPARGEPGAPHRMNTQRVCPSLCLVWRIAAHRPGAVRQPRVPRARVAARPAVETNGNGYTVGVASSVPRRSRDALRWLCTRLKRKNHYVSHIHRLISVYSCILVTHC